MREKKEEKGYARGLLGSFEDRGRASLEYFSIYL